MKYFLINLILVLLLFSTSACLRTRTQLKKDTSIAQTNQAKAEREADIDELKTRIDRLNGKIEEVEHNSTQKSNERIESLEKRLEEMEQNQLLMMSELKKIKDNNAKAPSKTAARATRKAKKKKYRNDYALGLKEFEKKRFDNALTHFQTYLRSYPKGKYADDSCFYAGESYYRQKNYKKAIIEYSKIQEKYPKSSYMARALFRISLSFSALGLNSEANTFKQELLDKYPKTSEAKYFKRQKKSKKTK